MAKNLIPEVCKMLGIEIGEEFKIRDKKGKDNGKYCIDQNGALLYLSAKKPIPHLIGIRALLNGELEIVKLPWKPKEDERYWTFGTYWSIEYNWWHNTPCDVALLAKGWVYRTAEEAETALSKVAEELEAKYEL